MPHLQLSGTALHGQGAHTDGQRSVPTFPYCHTERAAGSRGQEHPAAGQTEAQQCLTAAKGWICSGHWCNLLSGCRTQCKYCKSANACDLLGSRDEAEAKPQKFRLVHTRCSGTTTTHLPFCSSPKHPKQARNP